MSFILQRQHDLALLARHPTGAFSRQHRYEPAARLLCLIRKGQSHYGMPQLDFASPTRNCWDFAKMPYGTIHLKTANGGNEWRTAFGDTLNSDERPREFGVLNLLSQKMTEFASRVRDDNGKPVRRAWARQHASGPLIKAVPPASWFPEPFLGFIAADLKHLKNARIWMFCQRQMIHLNRRPGLSFLPAAVCQQIVQSFEPLEMIWDLSSSEAHINAALEAAIFPPIKIRQWNHFKLAAQCTNVKTGIGDPRFALSTSRRHLRAFNDPNLHRFKRGLQNKLL